MLMNAYMAQFCHYSHRSYMHMHCILLIISQLNSVMEVNIASVLVSGTDIFFIEKSCKIVEQWQAYTSSPVQFSIENVFELLL